MKCKEAMETDDKNDLESSVEEERKNTEKYDVWTPRKLQYFLPDAKIITSTWSAKKKTNGIYQDRLNVRDYEQAERAALQRIGNNIDGHT